MRGERERFERSVTVSEWYAHSFSWVKTRPVSVDAQAPAEPLGSSFTRASRSGSSAPTPGAGTAA